ncbi:xanthine dehydrogenase family protein molybdopterin-binding subunit [Caenimonas sedimenti]|uniref:Xanthine dehydrogenase family protein molybdopterin-binding subunit n=1 Tax=Caenimonas sedimenti TaxID=2596921 RepID=A0A562ZR29_9BURK|nr:xanthine dehydrogenase family protein molybdopterin-binding subunit [Caenimonas sedimenti]TWO70755.1 xanthine dehydrogenase family protein molybdopterin-binding subunit [Caenimonas sedimenti]
MRRRTWLLGGTAAAGALLVGWGVLPQRSRMGAAALLKAAKGEIALNGWIKIAEDGSVVLAMPRSEMGQGVHTALPMLAAEELDVPLTSVRIEQAGPDTIYGNVAMLVASLPIHPLDEEHEDGFGRVKASRWVVGKVARELGINATGGSSSVSDAWEVVRMAAATARASLLGAASLQWKQPIEELTVVDGVVKHAGSAKSATYGELARFAAATPPGTVTLKSRKDWKLIGRPAPRLDIPAKTDGSARFGLDVRLPGMRFAALRLCPMLGGSPGRIDPAAALAMPGVERVVQIPAYAGSTAGIAVVANSTWLARRAVDAVHVEWQARPGGNLDSERIAQELTASVKDGSGFRFHERGDLDAAEKSARVIESWYSAPYLAHATLEPMNCTAQVQDGRVQVWAPTQVPEMCRAMAARVAGVPPAAVEMHVTLLGGGFGRRLEVDYVAQAVRVAMDCGGAPVQLVWSREEDTRHDFYRPMHVARLRATVDAAGQPLSLHIKSAGDAISPRWMERGIPALTGPVDLPDKTTSEGLFDQPYGVPAQRMEHVATRMGVPVGFWRSVGHSHNAFFSESFIDELAVAGKADPLEFRRKLLGKAPRYLAVLDLAAEKAGWKSPAPAGRARGLALHESFGSIVAQVAEVSLGPAGPRVHRVVCAIDCGTVVNPGIVAQQMESSVVFGLTAVLHGRIDIHNGVVRQGNFADYPMVRMASTPQVETWIVPSERPPGGVGEPGVPPLAPAVANALFALTGERHRKLPLGSV